MYEVQFVLAFFSLRSEYKSCAGLSLHCARAVLQSVSLRPNLPIPTMPLIAASRARNYAGTPGQKRT